MIPDDEKQLCEIITQAAANGTPLEIRGGGSKSLLGAPDRTTTILDMSGFAGVIDYDPPELVLTVGAGTKLCEVETLVAAHGQMLAFEPFDHGPIYGQPAGAATMGGIVAAGIAGSRRLSAGAARDHLLGFTGVSGRGERFVAGARVVKNVTGYDLPKLAAGSWGRLMALTQVTLKVLPAPRETATRVIAGLDPHAAWRAMSHAMGSAAEVSAAAHIPAGLYGPVSLTALRIEGFGPSVAARCAMLADVLAGFGRLEPLQGDAIWQVLRNLSPLEDGPLWRVSLPARRFAAFVGAFLPGGARWLADWAGGLVWAVFEGDPALIRAAAAQAGGHAMLVRGEAGLRAAVPAIHPQPRGVAALEERVRRAFDPAGIFETGRFGNATDAD